MIIRVVIGVVVGGILGALLGYFGKCPSGVCPLTNTPWRGALYGAFWGLIIVLVMSK